MTNEKFNFCFNRNQVSSPQGVEMVVWETVIGPARLLAFLQLAASIILMKKYWQMLHFSNILWKFTLHVIIID